MSILYLFALTSCGTVKIRDSEWCGNLPGGGAACFHTLNGVSRDVSAEAWDRERVGRVCTDAATFADWKALLEQLCSVSKRCDYASP